MTMPAPRQLVLLGLLLAAGVVFVVFGPFGGSSPSAGATTGAPNRAGAQGKASDGDVPDVRLEQLQHDEGPFQTPIRNPFRFERRATAEAPRGPVRPRRIIEAPPPEPVGPPPDPPPPPIPLRFIGFVEPKDGRGRVAVLSDGRGTVIDGKEGDVIEGRYRLLRVGNDSADLAYLDGRGRQTIRLSGQ
jgi:hypothetical protein